MNNARAACFLPRDKQIKRKEKPLPGKGGLEKMADKNLSVEDILEEYTHKSSVKKPQEDVDIDSLLDGAGHAHTQPTKTEVIEDVLEIGDNSFVFDPGEDFTTEGGAADAGEGAAEKSAAAEKTAETVPDETIRHGSGTSQGTQALEETLSKPKPSKPVQEDIPKPPAGMPEIRAVTGRNADDVIMQGLLKLKSERGTQKPAQKKVAPVNRASINDIDLGIEKKVIPSTEVGLDENATEEERLAYLNSKRRERVKEFIAESEDESKPEKDSVADFESFDQAKEMADSIAFLKSSLVVRLCVLLVLGIVSAYMALATDSGLALIPLLTQPTSYVFANVLLGLVSAFVSYTVLSVGVKKLFTLKADSDSLAAVTVIFSLVSAIALLSDTELVQMKLSHVYVSVAIIGLLVNTMGKLLIVTRTERNFRYISGGYSKYAAMHIDDEDVAARFTKGALTDFPSLSTSRKTEFVNDFIKNSYSADLTDAFSKIYVPVAAGIAIIVGVITAFICPEGVTETSDRALYALSCAAGTMAVCSAMGMMLVTNIPLAKASKKYLQSSAVMLGYSAVDKFADTNSVLADAVDLFPDGMVDIINLKPVKKVPIEDGIIYAASLCCQTESILRSAFYKMIKGKTEMLYPVESYIYEDGLGLSGWIENKRVLFGNRALMESHSIEGVPSLEKEAGYAKGDSLVYLSIGGSLAMIFVVKIKPSVSVSRALRQLEKEKITVILRSVDSLLSITRLSELFGVSPNTFKLLPFRYHADYDAQTSYVAQMSSPMIYSGRFASLAMLLIGAKRLQRSAMVGVGIQALSALLGVVLAVIFAFTGSFGGVLTGSFVIIYNAVWAAVTAITQSAART